MNLKFDSEEEQSEVSHLSQLGELSQHSGAVSLSLPHPSEDDEEEEEEVERDLRELDDDEFDRLMGIDKKDKNQMKKMRSTKVDRKNQKIRETKAYEAALKKHRKECREFHGAYSMPEVRLKNKMEAIYQINKAMKTTLHLDDTARLFGIRSRWQICQIGIKKQFRFILDYLEENKISDVIREEFEELLRQHNEQKEAGH